MSRTGKNILGVIILAMIVGFYFYCTKLNENADKSSKYYTNSLYTSEARIYNNYLTNDEKDVYDIMFKMAKNRDKAYESSFDELHCKSGKTCAVVIRKIFYALSFDHPEILGLASYSYIYDTSTSSFTIKLLYATPLAISDYYGEMYITSVLEKIKEETEGMTDEEKIVYVYKWIGTNTYYDNTFKYTSKNQSAYNAIVRRNAVCTGFAKASAIMLNYIGVESYIIAGHSHMWNIVKLNGKYYYYDSTVAACRDINKDGFYDGLLQSYMNDYSVYYPEWNFEIEETNMGLVESGA